MARRGAAPVWRAALAFFTAALALAAGLAATAATAQNSKLEAAYVVLGGDGPIARAIFSQATACPAITLDGAAHPMAVRAAPEAGVDPAFPVLVCETAIPPGITSASVVGRSLPLPRTNVAAIAVIGDTGCRLKDATVQPLGKRDHDHPHDGRFQDCDELAQWPFPRLSKVAAIKKPDLVIHVGDYLYRESACPAGDAGCAGSPHGDTWATWKADFFAPATPLLATAPWIVVRGNHEVCARAGAGYFRFLYPVLASRHPPPPSSAPPACTDVTPLYTVDTGGRAFVVIDSSNAYDSCRSDTCDSAPYASQFAGMAPKPGTWFLSHRPIWGVGRNFTLNRTLQIALGIASKGHLPAEITLALSGHMHIFELLSFADQQPPQIIVGTGGTALDRPLDDALAGKTVGDAIIAYGRSEDRFGFLMITAKTAADRASATFTDADGTVLFACELTAQSAHCD